MMSPGWQLCVLLCNLLLGQAVAPNPVEPSEGSRPYAVLRGQNLEFFQKCKIQENDLSGVNTTFSPICNENLRNRIQKFLEIRAVLLGTIFSILLVAIILMAFCVYKPIRRR